jgi:hypothetical protein
VLRNLIVLLNCVVKLNCVVEILVEKGKIKLFVLFYNVGCQAICLSPNHGRKWPHGWSKFNVWQLRLRKASQVELGAQFNA